MSFLILDIESVIDGRLVQKIKYPHREDLSAKESIELYKKTILEDSNQKKDFIPYVFHLPVSMALIKTNDQLEIEKMTTLDRPHFRPQKITEEFWNRYESSLRKQLLTLVTFNGRGFDLPLMELSAFRYGLSAARWFSGEQTYNKPRYRYTEKYHFDLMELLTNFGATRFEGGLNLVATLLGKPGKMDVKGSEVQRLWDEGKKEEIDDYCLCDTLDTYFVFLRTQVLCGKISLEQETKIVKKAHERLEQEVENFPVLKKYLEKFTFWTSISDKKSGFMI